MKTYNLLWLLIACSAMSACDTKYFERSTNGTWRGATQVTTIINSGLYPNLTQPLPTTAATTPPVRNTQIVLNLVEEANSQTIVSAITVPVITAPNIIGAGSPTSTILIEGGAIDSVIINGRNANDNTVIFTISPRNVGAQTVPQLSFSGRFIDDNTIEGTLSQTLPRQRVLQAPGDTANAVLLQPRVFSVTLRLTR
jgi:hypothetical protein